jgi:hypothetical protein
VAQMASGCDGNATSHGVRQRPVETETLLTPPRSGPHVGIVQDRKPRNGWLGSA